MAAGFRGGDQVVELEFKRGFAEAVGKVLKLLGGSIELLHQGAQKGWIVCDDRLLFAPPATAGGIGKQAFVPPSHGLEAVKAVGQQTQMVAIHLRKQRGINPGDHGGIHGLQFCSGVMRKPQACPPSRRQCTRST